MYTPSFKVKNNGVPVLSKSEIEVIGENYIRDFCPDALGHPQAINIDDFVELYLGMKIDYQYLSNDGRYLGMTVFNDTDKVIIFDPEKRQADYLHADARTVIIDNTLLEEKQKQRYRYTMGHEGSHDIFHSGYYSYDPDQLTFFDKSNAAPMVQCRQKPFNSSMKTSKQWSDVEWMEWQANFLSSVLLMPAQAVRLVAAGNKHTTAHERSHAMIKAVAKTFDVSQEAAMYRLKELRCLNSGIELIKR
jgi:Zn-dependent peptidase ImmA (M78 family)